MPPYEPDDDLDRDAPQEIDLDETDDDDDSFDCPACGGTVYEDAPRCPRCGHWLTRESAASERSRGWFWPIIVAILVAVILVLWHGIDFL